MESSISKDIDNSSDELIKLIKHNVELILHKHYETSGILLDYDFRNDTVLHTYGVIVKKYLNDKFFESKKETYIRLIAIKYIFSKS